MLSFGSNDAAPWKQVPLGEFSGHCATLLRRTPAALVIVLGPPPATPANGRSLEVLQAYSAAARGATQAAGATFVPLLEHLTVGDLVEDGLHLSDIGYERVTALVAPLLLIR